MQIDSCNYGITISEKMGKETFNKLKSKFQNVYMLFDQKSSINENISDRSCMKLIISQSFRRSKLNMRQKIKMCGLYTDVCDKMFNDSCQQKKGEVQSGWDEIEQLRYFVICFNAHFLKLKKIYFSLLLSQTPNEIQATFQNVSHVVKLSNTSVDF